MKVKPTDDDDIDVSLLDSLLNIPDEEIPPPTGPDDQRPFIFGNHNEFEFSCDFQSHPVYLSTDTQPQIVYINSPGSGASNIPMASTSNVSESTRDVIRERLVRKVQTQGDVYPSVTDNKSQSPPKPSKNAEQARRNRQRKKEEETREKEEIKRARQTLSDLEHYNNQLKSEIMAEIQEQHRLEDAIRNDTILGKVVTLSPRQTSTVDISNYDPNSGGICLSLNDSSPSINLCLECSRRYSALNDLTKKEDISSNMAQNDMLELAESSEQYMSL